MSRHISGEPAAMRVKSRNRCPPGPAGDGRRRPWPPAPCRRRTQVRQMADRGERAVMRLRFHVDHRRAAKAARARARRRRVLGQRRGHHVAPAIQAGVGRSGPCVPRRRWDGTNCAQRPPRAARATSTTSALVLPASVRIARGASVGSIRTSRSRRPPTGVASRIMSARAAATSALTASSIKPSSSARASIARCALPQHLADLAGAAQRGGEQPPINPTPATARTGIRGQRPDRRKRKHRSCGRDRAQRLDEAGVFLRQSDTRSHSGRPSPATGRNDHATLEQFQIDAGRVAHMHQHEVAVLGT